MPHNFIIRLSTLDYGIIVAYFVITISLGLHFARRWKGSEDFFLAGRSLTWPLIGLSLFATNISAEHFVGLAAGGYREGLVQGGFEWMACFCLLTLAAVFAPQYLKHKVFTIPEYFEKRFGSEVRMLLTVYFLIMIIFTKTSVALYAGSQVLADLTGWNFQLILWGIGIVTAVYTIAGGLAAVVYTDSLQAIILIGGSIVLTGLGLDRVGWWSGLTERLDLLGKADLLSMVKGPEHALPFSGFVLSNFLVGGIFYWCMDQVNVQRVLGAKNVREARLGAIFAGFLKLIPVFILVLPGVIAVALSLNITGSNGVADYNRTYSVLVQSLLPNGMKGVVLAALLAALMSSISSMYNSASTLVARDLAARFKPDMPQPRQIFIGQIALLLVMVGGIMTTPLIGRYTHIWAYLQEVTAYFSVPFAVVGIGGIFIKRVNRSGAFAAIITGVIVSAVLMADSNTSGGLLDVLRHPWLYSFLHRSFLCAVISFIAFITVSLLTPPPAKEIRSGVLSFSWAKGEGETDRDFTLAKRWMLALLLIVIALLWLFR